jgi:hypothetical protein
MRGVRDHASNLGDWLFMLSTIIRRLIQALVAFLLMVRGADGGGGAFTFHWAVPYTQILVCRDYDWRVGSGLGNP